MISKFFKNCFKTTPKHIALAGVLVAIGIISDAYIRIGHTTFLTTSVYIALGLLLPIHIGILSAFIIDTLQLVLRGGIGYWYWELQLLPALLVVITFAFRVVFLYLKTKKQIYISYSFIFLMMIIAFVFMGTHYQSFIYKGSKSLGKVVVSYLGTILGFSLFIWLAIMFWKFKENKASISLMATIITCVSTAIIFDWILHPLAAYDYNTNILKIPKSDTLYRIYTVSGMTKSMIHISIAIPVVYFLRNIK